MFVFGEFQDPKLNKTPNTPILFLMTTKLIQYEVPFGGKVVTLFGLSDHPEVVFMTRVELTNAVGQSAGLASKKFQEPAERFKLNSSTVLENKLLLGSSVTAGLTIFFTVAGAIRYLNCLKRKKSLGESERTKIVTLANVLKEGFPYAKPMDRSMGAALIPVGRPTESAALPKVLYLEPCPPITPSRSVVQVSPPTSTHLGKRKRPSSPPEQLPLFSPSAEFPSEPAQALPLFANSFPYGTYSFPVGADEPNDSHCLLRRTMKLVHERVHQSLMLCWIELMQTQPEEYERISRFFGSPILPRLAGFRDGVRYHSCSLYTDNANSLLSLLDPNVTDFSGIRPLPTEEEKAELAQLASSSLKAKAAPVSPEQRERWFWIAEGRWDLLFGSEKL